MDCSGLIQGPPLPHQPGPMPSVTSIPSRSASRTAWTNASCHGSVIHLTGPLGMPMIHFEEDQVAEARRLHGFQVGGHLLAVQIAVHGNTSKPRAARSPAD